MFNKRSDAMQAGEKYYNTGKECKNGHSSDRLTVDGSCNKCRAIYQKQQREEFRKRAAKAGNS